MNPPRDLQPVSTVKEDVLARQGGHASGGNGARVSRRHRVEDPGFADESMGEAS